MCRDSRLSLGITQERLATKVGVTRSHIGKIERGVGNPTVRVMEAMAEALGIELDLVARMPIIRSLATPFMPGARPTWIGASEHSILPRPVR